MPTRPGRGSGLRGGPGTPRDPPVTLRRKDVPAPARRRAGQCPLEQLGARRDRRDDDGDVGGHGVVSATYTPMILVKAGTTWTIIGCPGRTSPATHPRPTETALAMLNAYSACCLNDRSENSSAFQSDAAPVGRDSAGQIDRDQVPRVRPRAARHTTGVLSSVRNGSACASVIAGPQ